MDNSLFCGKDPSKGKIYNFKLLKIVDGDTQDLLFDLGFGVLKKGRIRLLGVDTPEKVGKTKPAGVKATQFTTEWYRKHPNAVAVVYGFGKYGRPLTIIADNNSALNQELIRSKNAKLYCGGKKQ